MYEGFGVTVTFTPPGSTQSTTAPLVAVSRDERDAEAVAERAAGGGVMAETLRELSPEEILEHGLDLQAHGSAKSLPIHSL